MSDADSFETEQSENSVIRVYFTNANQGEIANDLFLCLKKASSEHPITVNSEFQPPLPNTLGALELIIELVIAPVTARLAVNALMAGLALFAEKYIPEPSHSFVVRLLFPQGKRKKKNFPLGKMINKALLERLQEAIEEELSANIESE